MGRHTRACAKRWSECNEKLPVTLKESSSSLRAICGPPPQDDIVRNMPCGYALVRYKKLGLVEADVGDRTFSDP